MASNQAFLLTTITNEHTISLDELCDQLKTNKIHGIKETQAKTLRKENGYNKFEPPRRNFISEFRERFTGRQLKREKSFSKSEWKKLFGDQLPPHVTVIRDGVRKEILCKHIVIGDLIELKRNDVVPADIRLSDSHNVVVDNRLITGQTCEPRTHRLIHALNDCLLFIKYDICMY